MSGQTPIIEPPKPPGSSADRWRRDTVAGLINAVASVPDGLASAALAGVNPLYGLYASITGPIFGSIFSSAQLMQIATTSASALVAGQAISGLPAERQSEGLFLLVVLVGVLLLVFGLLRLGRLIRFVSHAVMTGFLIGVASVLILDQLAPFVGFHPKGANEVSQFVDLLSHLTQFNVPTILTGSLALGIAFALERTRLATISSFAALIIPSLLVAALHPEGVTRVADVVPIPSGIPVPTMPDLTLLTPEIITSAFALAVVIGIQGAGVSQIFENPDGSRISVSRDMIAQGAGNFASGVFSGIPVGGSVGQTALNAAAGARTRWSGILHGVWMLVIVLLVPGLVGRVPMAVLAALMIQAGIAAIDLREARSIWNTGGAARLAILVTFAATLVMSIPLAVAVGVVLTIVLYLASAASDVSVVELIRQEDGRIAEGPPAARLPSNAVTVLDVEGSLFFAGARTLGDKLPRVEDAKRPVVILRLRGYTRAGATLIDVLDDYGDRLADAGGRLYLSGVNPEVEQHLRSAGKLDLDKTVFTIPAESVLGASTDAAALSAREWLGSSVDPAKEQK